MYEFKNLIQEIKEYDSDAFFAKGCNLTDLEAIELADKCVRWFVINRLDGVMLDQFLAEIREE
jgi:hypothetical protein